MSLLELLKELPQEDQEAVMNELYTAIKWRGWDSSSQRTSGFMNHAAEAVQKIVTIFEKHGRHFEEYT